MKLIESILTAINSLRANKMRSALTMLGIIIGVGSIILLVSLGSGARTEITNALQGMGSNLLIVVPYKLDLSGNLMQQGSPALSVNKLTMKTADEIGRVIGDTKRVSPVIQRQSVVTNGRKKFYGIINATSENEFEVRNIRLARGRFYTQTEVESAKRVAVIGETVAKTLFGDEDPIGKYFVCKGRKIKVIGIQEPKGKTLTFDLDSFIWMPVTCGIKIFGTTNPNLILVKASSTEMVDKDAAEIRKALSKHLSSDEFSVVTQSDILSFAKDITKILTYLLGGLAGISLIVGGIGIMNIMLVSVTERTREIGIRKAVGAKTRDILIQFLVESVVLSLVGGTIGVILAILGSKLYESIFHFQTQVTIWIVLLAFLFSMLVGIFFGVYPARKASRLDPIESLRYE